MAEERAPSPQSFILLIGPPRSGTTLIANTFMSHSKVSGVMEPYQRRRKRDDTGTTDLDGFIAENRVRNLANRPHLAMKETTTRLANIDLSLGLMQSAASQGIYTGVVMILRCPFSAFLSQVEASSEMWGEKKLTDASKQTFRRWARGQKETLKKLTDHVRSQHYRIISYEAFCADPGPEMARLMGLIPERLEPAQMNFTPPDSVIAGGDPKTREKSGKIELSDRADRIKALGDMVGPCPERKFMQELRNITINSACIDPDRVTLDHLSRLLA